MVVQSSLYEHDLRQTMQNRERLRGNANLLHWYEQLYRGIFGPSHVIDDKVVLEIGSGASPLKMFYPRVITSDILNLDHLDHVFDCQEIDQYAGLEDASCDIITMTNVLHHVRDPLAFLKRAVGKLAPAGEVIMVEPYFSALSYPIYKLLHHEPADFSIKRPLLDRVEGPLSSSNQAIPYMLFVSRPGWLKELAPMYDVQDVRLDYFSSLSYMASGGIARNSIVPASLYRLAFPFDRFLARLAPLLFASFFVARLKRKGV